MKIGKKSIRIRNQIKKKKEMYIERALGKLRKLNKIVFQKMEPKQEKNTSRMQGKIMRENLQKGK